MSKQLENARNLYLRGIRDGQIKEVQENYMGNKYVQHSTGVPDGKNGFEHFFKDFFIRNPKREIEIVRSIEDENFVFMHVYQKLNDGDAQWITADIFRSDENERIVEHWDVIDAYLKPSEGEDPIFGEFLIKDLHKTEENKKQIRRFLTEIMQNKEYELFFDYVSDELIQHNQEIGQGGQAYRNFLIDNNVNYDFVFKVMGQGNYVIAYSKVFINGTDYALFDIFRMDNGKIVEHWDNKEIIPLRESLTNSGKF